MNFARVAFCETEWSRDSRVSRRLTISREALERVRAVSVTLSLQQHLIDRFLHIGNEGNTRDTSDETFHGWTQALPGRGATRGRRAGLRRRALARVRAAAVRPRAPGRRDARTTRKARLLRAGLSAHGRLRLHPLATLWSRRDRTSSCRPSSSRAKTAASRDTRARRATTSGAQGSSWRCIVAAARSWHSCAREPTRSDSVQPQYQNSVGV